MKKINEKLFLEILKINSRKNPLDIDKYDKTSIIECRKNYKSHQNFYIKFICKDCNKIIIKNMARNTDKYCNIEFITTCGNCLTKKTNIEKYGCENVFQNEEIKKRIKETLYTKYGGFTFESKYLSKKAKKTCKEKYGAENVFELEEFQEKGKKTRKEKYGVEYYSKTEEYNDKVKTTSLNRYNVEHPSKSETIKVKKKETCLKKYGCENPMQNENIKNKSIEKNKNNNDGIGFGSDKINKKIKKTNRERYGTEYPTQNNDVLDKIKNTCFEKYGVDNYSKSKEFKQYLLETYGTLHISHKYTYNNINFDSSWELAFYIYHKDKKHKIKHEPKIFSYLYNSEEHNYCPDFKVGNKYYEIKGNQFLIFYKNGKIKGFQCPFNHNLDDLYNTKYKCMKKHNVVIIYSKTIQRYLNYIEKNYGRDYLESFRGQA